MLLPGQWLPVPALRPPASVETLCLSLATPLVVMWLGVRRAAMEAGQNGEAQPVAVETTVDPPTTF